MARLGLANSMAAEAHLNPQVNLELEYNDALRASRFTFKFVAFKTPTSTEHQLPKDLFFTFKFFTKQTAQTEIAKLHSKDGQIKLAQQYYLVLPDTLRLMANSQKPEFETVLDSALQVSYDVSASEHTTLVNYLKDSVLTIDVWDGQT